MRTTLTKGPVGLEKTSAAEVGSFDANEGNYIIVTRLEDRLGVMRFAFSSDGEGQRRPPGADHVGGNRGAAGVSGICDRRSEPSPWRHHGAGRSRRILHAVRRRESDVLTRNISLSLLLPRFI